MAKYEMNPFITGSAVKGDSFFNRKKLLTKIDTFLYQSTDATLILYGQRRIGKTSLLRKIQEKILLNNGKVTLFDLQNKADFILSHLLTDFIKQIAVDLHLKININEEIRKQKNIEDYFINTFLPLITGDVKESENIVFLFDEFDVIGLYPDICDNPVNKDTAHHLFLPFLIDILKKEYPLKFIFAVGCNYKDLDLSRYKELVKFGKKEEIGYFPQNELETMILSLTDNTIPFEKDAIDLLYKITAGQVYFSQCLASTAFDEACKLDKKKVTSQLIQNQLDNAINSYGGGVIWLWDSFSAEEKIFLYLMAVISNKNLSVNKKSINEHASAYNVLPALQNVQIIINRLKNLKIIKKMKNNTIHFQVEYFRKWILKEISVDDLPQLFEKINTEINLFINNARYNYNNKNYKEAEKYYLQILDEYPAHFEAIYTLGLIYKEYLKKDFTYLEKAFSYLEKAYFYNKYTVKDDFLEVSLMHLNNLLADESDEKIINEKIKEILSCSEYKKETIQLIIEICISNKHIVPEIMDAYLPAITEINIPDKNIDILPPVISQLTNLEILDIRNNKIKQIPPELITLKKLQHVYLEGNPIDFPGELKNITIEQIQDHLLTCEQYDAFISYSSEDLEWVKQLKQSLEFKGADTWVDYIKIKPGQSIPDRINEGFENSRFVLFVMTPSGVESVWGKRETAYVQMAFKQEKLIPLLVKECEIPLLLQPVRYIDFRNKEDFPLKIKELLEVMGIPDRLKAGSFDKSFSQAFTVSHKLRGEETYKTGKAFEKEVADTYRLLGFEVEEDINIEGIRFDLKIQKKDAGFKMQALIECKNLHVTAKERDQILALHSKVMQLYPGYGHFVVSSRRFAEQTKNTLNGEGIECLVYKEILAEIFPLEKYVQNLVKDIEEWINDKNNWNGKDRFIRPFLLTDIGGGKVKALEYFSEWLDDDSLNHLTILGDLGTGKSTLSRFLSHTLGISFLQDPLKHPAPVLIPLKDVRKAVNLPGIVIDHFTRYGIPDINYTRFEYMVKKGRIILFFDAFDEMAEKIEWETTRQNFRELNSIVGSRSKVILTCRTHFFINREEQAEILGSGGSPTLSEIETDLYKEITHLPEYSVVYLEEFTDDQILEYLYKTRGNRAKKDFAKIKSIYNLRDLAHRPLLLDIIVKSLPRLKLGEQISASQLYNVYTGIWLEREQEKHPHLRPEIAECMMRMLSWFMWNKEDFEISFDILIPFIRDKIKTGEISIKKGNEETLARELATATFLKRIGDTFTFAHKSFAEYFLALHLFKCLLENDPCDYSVLKTRRFDRKTIYFLAFLDIKDKLGVILQDILIHPYTRQVSENCLTILYWMTRIKADMEKEITDIEALRRQMSGSLPEGIRMQKADLKGIILDGAVLKNVDFSGSILSKAVINNALISNTSLKGADCTEAAVINTRFESCNLDAIDLTNAEVKHTAFYQVSFKTTLLENAVFSFIDINGIKNISGAVMNKVIFRENRKKKRLIPLHQWFPVNYYHFTTNKSHTLLFAGSDDGTIHIFETTSLKRISVLKGHSSRVRSLVMHTENRLFSGSDDNTIREWDTDTGECLNTLKGHTHSVRSLVIQAENRLFSGSDDNTIREWNTDTGECLKTLKGHTYSVRSLVMQAENRLFSGSDDNTIREWNTDSGECLNTLKGHTHSVRSLVIQAENRLFSGSDDNTIRVWNTDTGECLKTLKNHTDWVTNLVIHSENRLLSGSDDNTIREWNTDTGECLKTLKGHSGGVTSFVMHTENRLFSGSNDNTIRVWSTVTGECLKTLKGHTDWVTSLVTHMENRLFSGSDDNTIREWNTDSGECLKTLKGHSGGVISLALHMENRLFSGSDDNTIREWNTDSGECLKTLKGHSGWVTSLVMHAENWLFSGSDDTTIRVWNTETGECLKTLKGHLGGVTSLVLYTVNRLFSGSDDSTIRVWDADTGKCLKTLKGHLGGVTSLVMYTENRLFSGSDDTTIREWDIDTGECVHILSGHDSYVNSLMISFDRRTLYSGSSDNTVIAWDIATGKRKATFVHMDKGKWLCYLPDGRFNAHPKAVQYLTYLDPETKKVYPAEDIAKRFYKPEEVAKALQNPL